jgi:hypothetical protein
LNPSIHKICPFPISKWRGMDRRLKFPNRPRSDSQSKPAIWPQRWLNPCVTHRCSHSTCSTPAWILHNSNSQIPQPPRPIQCHKTTAFLDAPVHPESSWACWVIGNASRRKNLIDRMLRQPPSLVTCQLQHECYFLAVCGRRMLGSDCRSSPKGFTTVDDLESPCVS